MPPIAARDVRAQRLARAYTDAWNRLIAEERRIASDPLAFRRRARLAELEREIKRQMAGLDANVRAWIGRELPAIWSAGATAMSATGDFGWTLLHSRGINLVAQDTYEHLLEATRYVNASTKALVQSIVRDETLAKLTGGTTARQEGRVIMERLIGETGLSRVAYANGALHPLGEYGEMAARTTSAHAYNFGAIQQAREEGTEMLEVFDGPSCGWTAHSDPDTANGKLVSLTEAATYPTSHPNCLRAFGGRPDLRAKKAATDPQIETAAVSGVPEGRSFARQSALARRDARLAKRAARVI